LRETASYELSCVKISSVDFPVEDGKKKKGREGNGTERKDKKSRKRYISPIHGEAPRKLIFTKFCTSGDMLDVIICANFGVEKLRGFGNTRGQILEFPIEMAGHLYNRAGATAQPVIEFFWLISGAISHYCWWTCQLATRPITLQGHSWYCRFLDLIKFNDICGLFS